MQHFESISSAVSTERGDDGQFERMAQSFRTSVTTRKSTLSLCVRLIWPFVELAKRRGRQSPNAQSVEAYVRAKLGLTQAVFADPDTRVPLQCALDVLEEAISASKQPALGLLAAELMDSEHIGIIEYLARSQATLGEALTSLARYIRLLGDGVNHSVEIRHGLAHSRIWFDNEVVMSDAAYELALATSWCCLRRVSGRHDLAPLEVHFTHPEPSDTSIHQRIFRCPIRFNMPVTQLVLLGQALEVPLASADPVLGRLLERQADAMLTGLPRTDDLVTRIRDMLAAEADLRDTSATRVARRLNMSVRTLARRLGEESTSYRLLLNDTRKQVALRDLAQTMRPISDIAHQLGFANSQSFHRAFRRWTGLTAASYRDKARQRKFA